MSSLPRTVTALAVLLAVLAPSAHAATDDGARRLLDSTRSQKARTGLGLPHYKGLLGKKWESKVKKADGAFAGRLAPPSLGRIGAAQLDANDPLSAKDSLKGKAGSQTRSMRIASSLDSGCPAYQSYGAFELKGQARGDYQVKTVERIGRYDVTTIVIFEVRFAPFSQIGRGSTVAGISAHGGTVTVTRTQTARDRRTGRSRRTGPTQRLAEGLSTLLVLDGDFADFISQQDRDERPAPRRPLRSAVWRDAAQKFVAVVYAAVEREFKAAEKRMQTPNTCASLSFTGPDRLTPSQVTDITGIVRPAQGEAPPEAMLEGLTILTAEYVNEQGQRIEQLGGNDDWKPGQPWYRFTAPPQAWPDAKPVGLFVRVATSAGVAEGEITFRAQDAKVYFRVLDMNVTSNWSASSDEHFCGRISGSQRWGGSLAPRPFDPQNAIEMRQGRWSGIVSARINAAWTDHHVQGCKTNELGQRVPCSEHLPDATPVPDGTWPLGFRVRQAAGSGDVELLWSLLLPTVGYSEPEEDECFVYLEGRVPSERKITRVPAERLLGSGPITLTFADSIYLGPAENGGPETLDYTWSYTITIQRVGADGNPL